jgi:hypothetical protein
MIKHVHASVSGKMWLQASAGLRLTGRCMAEASENPLLKHVTGVSTGIRNRLFFTDIDKCQGITSI